MREEGYESGRDMQYKGALRLFGALSRVREDYLEACEEDLGAKGRAVRPSMARLIQRYGRAAAAALCLAVLGVGYLSLRVGVFSGGFKGNDSASGAVLDAGMGGAADTSGENGSAAGFSVADAAPEMAPEESLPAADRGLDTDGAASSVTSEESSKTESAKQRDLVEELSIARHREMTLAEAEGITAVGAYLPTAWPSDGELTGVRGRDQEGAEEVSLTWNYGNQWDSFVVTVTNLGATLPAWVLESEANVSEPEAYDKRNYTISYADTVPSKYGKVFQNPIFPAEDFTRACVEARILPNVGDSGDTDTPRGNFCVLYHADAGEYVLVSFSGRGSVEDVWRVMHSIN